MVAQFRTIASLEPGMILAILASLLILAGLYFHRRAYKPLVEALYSDASHCEVETEVTFEDGRKGVMNADLVIREAQCVASLAKAS